MRRTVLLLLAVAGYAPLCPGAAQERSEPQELPPAAVLEVTPTELTLEVGEGATLTAVAKDSSGAVLAHKVVFYSRARQSVGVNAAGEVEAYRPGEHVIVALVPKDPEEKPRRAEALLQVEIPVTVPKPPVRSIDFTNVPERLYAGMIVPLAVEVTDETRARRTDVAVEYTTGDPTVAEVNPFGHLSLLRPGQVTVEARAEAVVGFLSLDVEPNPILSLELESDATEVRTGDVVGFRAVARDSEGRQVEGLPVRFAVSGRPAEEIVAPGATAFIEPDGRFVAERSGIYTVVAVIGSLSAVRTISVESRDVKREIEIVGHGAVRDRHTSDLWVWEGADGHDYAITGTWGADGHAYIWDVTHPGSMVVIDTVRVDARTVNDVKVSEDGTIAVISREGASNRKNGLVILDVSEPQVGVRILSRFDDQLNGGVHNLFVYDGHVYALNNGRRFDVINIEDSTDPYRVGYYRLDVPGHAIHDIWVADGIAYTSNWRDGVAAIDVGGGGRGGSPGHPVKLGSYAYPNGWNHAAFPYRSSSTGKFYVFAGDEAFPVGQLDGGEGAVPNRAAGWIHIVEWEDWESPREVARYQVPEAGSHNFWVEDDVLYVAYYNGGFRVVDVSGELLGDLYRQGREIASWIPYDPEGYVPNAPFTWGPQPFKGYIFVADWNSGLWALKLRPKEGPGKVIGEPQ